MAKIEDCTHVELYQIAYSDIEPYGSKFALILCLKDPVTEVAVKKVAISMSNISKFLKESNIHSILRITGSYIRCLINEDKKINYVGLVEDSWTVCKDMNLRGDK